MLILHRKRHFRGFVSFLMNFIAMCEVRTLMQFCTAVAAMLLMIITFYEKDIQKIRTSIYSVVFAINKSTCFGLG